MINPDLNDSCEMFIPPLIIYLSEKQPLQVWLVLILIREKDLRVCWSLFLLPAEGEKHPGMEKYGSDSI